MKRVIIESPYAGETEADTQANVEYARACMRDSLMRGEAPLLSHLLYTQVLDDTVPDERTLGINAGQVWRHVCDYYVVYMDRGISKGMQIGIDNANRDGIPVVLRAIEK